MHAHFAFVWLSLGRHAINFSVVYASVTQIFFFFQSIMAYNGAAVVAMKGKDCVAIAADRRFGIQAQTVSMDFQKIFEMGPRLYVGLPGLATDVQTV